MAKNENEMNTWKYECHCLSVVKELYHNGISNTTGSIPEAILQLHFIL